MFSFGLGIISTVGLFQPNEGIKNLAKSTIGFSIAGVVLGELITGKAISESNKFTGTHEELIKVKTKELSTLINQKESELTNLNQQLATTKQANEFNFTNVQRLEKELNTLKDIINQKTQELTTARDTVNRLKVKLADVGRFSQSEAYQIVRKTYDRAVKKLEGLLDALVRNHPEIREDIQPIYIEVDSFQSRYLQKLSEYESCESFEELLDVGLELQEKIIDRCVELKVKAQTILIRYLENICTDSIPYVEFETHLNDLAEKAGRQIELNQRAIATEWIDANNQHIQNYETEFTEVLTTGKYALSRMQDMENQLENLQHELSELRKPLQFTGSIDYAVAGNSIIGFYYSAYGYCLDAISWQETETGYTLTFATSRNKVFLTADMLHDKDNRPQLAGLTNALELPLFSPNYQSGLMVLEVITRKPVKKATSAQELKFKDLVSLGSKRSYLVTGHPGAGKTSTMIFLGQQLGGVDAMRIALNPHNDTKSSYERFGFVEINNLDAIVEQIILLYGEVKLRRADPERRHPLVVCLDELSAVLDASEDAKGMMEIIRQIAVEGRKLGMIVIVGSHSQTTKAIDMDGEFRGSFYQLFLVGAARNAIDQPHRKTSLKPQQEQWIRESAYPVLLLANAQYSIVKHPTHGDYEEYKDEGNYPDNLEDWDINPLSIAVSNSVKSEYILTQTSTHVLPNVTATTTQVENHYPERYSKGSESYPVVESVKNPENNAKKEGSGKNLGSKTSKTPEPLIDNTSGYNTLPVLTQGEIELLNKYNYEPVSSVIKKIWNISPSKYPSYLNRKEQVETFRKQSKGAK